MINRDMLDRASWHAGTFRVTRLLRDSDTTTSFDFIKAGGAIVQLTGEDDTDDPWPISLGSRSKQWIDRRTGMVLARATCQVEMSGPNDQVA
jgi:hypothetical protein